MDFVLQPTTYNPNSTRVAAKPTFEPQSFYNSTSTGAGRSLQDRGALSPSYDEDLPTPRANQFNQQQGQYMRREKTEFNELYDVTDDESEFEDVPLFASRSIKRGASNGRRSNIHSLVIPSPSAWPSIEKLQKDGRLPDFPLSPPILSPTPRNLSKLATHNLQAPERNSTPSLDGSITSEELSNLSCPSTPDIEGQRSVAEEWGVHLNAAAMQTLNGISVDPTDFDQQSAFHEERTEMQETVSQLRCDIDAVLSSVDASCDDPISAISVPSPGGFFSSLDDASRNTWVQPSTRQCPDTSTAESFYGVPWRTSSAAPASDILERYVEINNDNNTDGPPTARRIETPMAPVSSTTENFQTIDYDANYVNGLKSSAAASFDRTSVWLSCQESYLSSLVDSTEAASTPITSPSSSVRSPASVRTPGSASTRSRDTFGDLYLKSPISSLAPVDEADESVFDNILPPSPEDATFLEGFKHVRESVKKGDAFTQRQARIEALHLDRKLLSKGHRDQLQGKYEVTRSSEPKSTRPVSDFYATEEPSEKSAMISRVQEERSALEQIKPISWNLEATKMLNGGTLLTSPAGKTLFSSREARVLDLGGQASCDWAWEVALQHPSAQVTTVYTADQAPKSTAKLQGPNNHRHRAVPNLWTLPFPSNHFDIISARSLYVLLKTAKPQSVAGAVAASGGDEYDLCIRECFRCLKPGGYFEFAVLDADLLHPGRQAQALSVEFGFNLRTRGYDPAPTKSFLPRLKRAGFGRIQRAWLALPMAPRSEEGASNATKQASYLSGMVGAWAWERWMLKLQVEMGRSEERLLEGVAGAIEEGGEVGTAWRYLSGWAKK